jgi:hypothetical protein
MIIAGSAGMERLPVNEQLLRVMEESVDKNVTDP